jgi:hypothetical protein
MCAILLTPASFAGWGPPILRRNGRVKFSHSVYTITKNDLIAGEGDGVGGSAVAGAAASLPPQDV